MNARVGVAVLVAGMLAASRASAGERTRGPSGLARWRKPQIVLEVVVPAGLPQTERALLFSAAEAAAASWRTPCSSAEIRVRPAGGSVYAASPDGRSTITVLPSVWCRAGQPTRSCHDPRALAETTIAFERGPRAADGESSVSEADVEINAVTFSWLGYQRQVDPGVPLQAVLTHEMGHVLGLDDGCREQDKRCVSGEPSIMTTISHHGRGAASPTPADLALLCTIYPRAPASSARE